MTEIDSTEAHHAGWSYESKEVVGSNPNYQMEVKALPAGQFSASGEHKQPCVLTDIIFKGTSTYTTPLSAC